MRTQYLENEYWRAVNSKWIWHEGKKRNGMHLYEMMALTVLRDEHVLGYRE